mmetsp:Transcript_57862/g.165975  ORF Transcript_57862/g.165975 Transcript_57862/m.165975 type:complete len:236 (-) Transcript_57862:86-793(-)
MLRGVGPDRSDRRVREEGWVPGGLLQPPAEHAQVQPRGCHELREEPSGGQRRCAAHRRQPGCQGLHGAEQVAGDDLDLAGGTEGQPAGPGAAPDAAPGHEPPAGPQGRRGNPADENVHSLRQGVHRPVVREGGLDAVGARALSGRERPEASADERGSLHDSGIPRSVFLKDATGNCPGVPHRSAPDQPSEFAGCGPGRHQVPRADRRGEARGHVRDLRLKRRRLLLPRCDSVVKH